MLQCKILSSLAKVFADEEPTEESPLLSILRGETASCQIAVKSNATVRVTAVAPGFRVQVRRVDQVPVGLACQTWVRDTGYLRKTPGLYPDLLRPLRSDGKCQCVGWWRAFWIDAEPESDTPGGAYLLTIRVEEENGAAEMREVPLHLVNQALAPQRLKHTQWFHADCLADYYHVPVWSEQHWRIVENFVRSAVRMGMNMILTPIFTPALDTAVGMERTTVQLTDVFVENGRYRFAFEKLERWVRLCQNCGITEFEMAHLYSQWSSNRTPKVMAMVDGTYQCIFGWETEGTGRAYQQFLAAFLPALEKKLRQLGIADRCRFHISDEPDAAFLPCYLEEKRQVETCLPGACLMDALSHFDFYAGGAVDCPVAATDCQDIDRFLTAELPERWLYYCCGQRERVSNRFIAMPSARNRILGTQLYACQADGFLQWGFNFYNSGLSRYPIDPFAVTDADGAFEAGDPFIVYPGENGQPLESIRYMVFRQGLHDLRALETLEILTDRETVEKIIAEMMGVAFGLDTCPCDNERILRLRWRINEEIEKHIVS